MVIKLTFSIPLKSIKEFGRQVAELPPLPEYINKRGPYINGARGARNQIIFIYEFEKTKLAETWENIFKHLDVFRGVPGFSLFAQILKEGTELKNFDLVEKMEKIRKTNIELDFLSELAPRELEIL